MNALDYARQHYDRFVEELFDFLRIPSVSTEAARKQDIQRAANWLAAHCRHVGLERVEVFETPGHPIVYAEWLGAKGAPTVLVYGHYDVQPAEKADGWDTEPFTPAIRDGNIIARGATDDKGQLFVHLKAFEAFMQTAGTFPVNIKMLFEGEEETSSLNLGPFIDAHQDLLRADVAVISDTAMFEPGVPAIPYGLRGVVLTDLEVVGPANDLHSGMYGGTVHNPIHALSELIATMHGADGQVAIEGFYDAVRTLDDTEREQLAKIPYTEAVWQRETGAPQPWGEPAYSLIERIGARPTLDIVSIKGGFLGDGTKAIIPHKALAKLSCRLVPDQDPDMIIELIRHHVEAHTPPTVQATLTKLHTASPVLINRDNEAMQVAIEACEKVFGKKPIFLLVGGSIPVVTDFQHKLGLPTILLGFGLPDDNLHGPNEKFSIEQFQVGIQTMLTFYSLLPERVNQ
ncbi:MAG: dipeptidase [Chloroflexi bacterium]|nr:dipeptidase [Chloroflexota bacterium]